MKLHALLQSQVFTSLVPRLSVPDFVSQLSIFLQSCETKSGTESLGTRLGFYPQCLQFSLLPINFSILLLDLAQFSLHLCLQPSSVLL